MRIVRRRDVLCPECLHLFAVPGQGHSSCSRCGEVMSRLYSKEASRSTTLPIPVLGWEGHGKSTYLGSLMAVLIRMGKVWPQFRYAEGTEGTQTALEQAREALAQGQLPEATGVDQVRTQALIVQGMERWGDRILLLRDSVGSRLNRMITANDDASFLLEAPVGILVVSQTDLRSGSGRSFEMLLNNYLGSLVNCGVDLRPRTRSLVVVLSKADLVLNLPTSLRRYLVVDELWGSLQDGSSTPWSHASSLSDYCSELQRVDQEIRDWVEVEPAWRQAIQQAEARGVELRFCLVSSTGSPVRDDGRTVYVWSPRRVIDPLFWTLELAGEEMPSRSRSDRGLRIRRRIRLLR